MKNKAIEAMIRAQFNVPEDVDVTVEFLAMVQGNYEFEVFWMVDSVHHQCNCVLPQLTTQTKKLED